MTPKAYLTIDDFSDDDVDWILGRAAELKRGQHPSAPRGAVLGLLFLEPSLRTRVGFAAAAARLGWQSVEVTSLRDTPTSFPETLEDTLRTLSGYCDVVVARPGCAMTQESTSRNIACPLVNGGDVGPTAEHPTQALVDLFAIEQLAGPTGTLRIAVVGDVRMRANRSLLTMLRRRPPAELVVVTHPALRSGGEEPSRDGVSFSCDLADAVGADVVYAGGIPHASMPVDERQRLVLTRGFVESLSSDAIVLSPMPVLDEIELEAHLDPRVQFARQSDLGLYARMATIERSSQASRELCDG